MRKKGLRDPSLLPNKEEDPKYVQEGVTWTKFATKQKILTPKCTYRRWVKSLNSDRVRTSEISATMQEVLLDSRNLHRVFVKSKSDTSACHGQKEFCNDLEVLLWNKHESLVLVVVIQAIHIVIHATHLHTQNGRAGETQRALHINEGITGPQFHVGDHSSLVLRSRYQNPLGLFIQDS